MKLLIYGAGVIGSLYAAAFAEAGYDTTMYARGKKLETLKTRGLLYEKNGKQYKAKVKVIATLKNDDIYDFIFLTVKENQVHTALEELRRTAARTSLQWSIRLNLTPTGRTCAAKGVLSPRFRGWRQL